MYSIQANVKTKYIPRLGGYWCGIQYYMCFIQLHSLFLLFHMHPMSCKKGPISLGNTSNPTSEFQWTFVSFRLLRPMDPKGFGAVDGSEIPNNHLGCIPTPADHGINYHPQLLFSPDFWFAINRDHPPTEVNVKIWHGNFLSFSTLAACGGWWPEKNPSEPSLKPGVSLWLINHPPAKYPPSEIKVLFFGPYFLEKPMVIKGNQSLRMGAFQGGILVPGRVPFKVFANFHWTLRVLRKSSCTGSPPKTNTSFAPLKINGWV